MWCWGLVGLRSGLRGRTVRSNCSGCAVRREYHALLKKYNGVIKKLKYADTHSVVQGDVKLNEH